eukprot:SM000113S24036  [mRNA]  locus=s113:41549:43106:- [translate_table: standard]
MPTQSDVRRIRLIYRGAMFVNGSMWMDAATNIVFLSINPDKDGKCLAAGSSTIISACFGVALAVTGSWWSCRGGKPLTSTLGLLSMASNIATMGAGIANASQGKSFSKCRAADFQAPIVGQGRRLKLVGRPFLRLVLTKARSDYR